MDEVIVEVRKGKGLLIGLSCVRAGLNERRSKWIKGMRRGEKSERGASCG